MLVWIYENIATIIICAVLIIVIAAIIINMVKNKKKGKSVDEMRKEMKGTDALTQFEKAYAEKNGFFNACKIYNAWKKENKK